MAKSKTLDQQASVTIQMPQSRKDGLGNLAFLLGLRRLVEGAEQGNISAAINLIVEFVFENKDMFSTWLKTRAEKALSK